MSTLVLSGWAQPADALAHLIDEAEENLLLFDYSDYSSLEAVLAALKHVKHRRCIGWSLGGALALEAIAVGALTPTHLTLIATPYQFVQTPEYRPAMDPFTYATFCDNYATNPSRTKERFHALTAKGDLDFKRVLGDLRHHPKVDHASHWLPWLKWLGQQQAPLHEKALAALERIPTFIVHGKQDAIVHVQQGIDLEKAMPNASISVWGEAGHAPHLHDAQQLKALIAQHRQAHGV